MSKTESPAAPAPAAAPPAPLSIELLDKAQQQALLKRLASGKPLSDKQLDQLRASVPVAARPMKSRKTRGRRGRPRRAIVPGAAATPAAVEISIADAQRAALTTAMTRAAAGKPLQNSERRLLRDAWLSDMALHIWPSLDVCAADLAVSANTVRNMAKEGCPGIEAASPIPKAPVLTWLLKRAHERGAGQHVDGHSLEEVEFRIKNAKASKMERTLIAEAEDLAAQGVIATMTNLRHHLLHTLPANLYAAVNQATDQVSAEDAINRLIAAALQSFATKAKASPAAPPAMAAQQTSEPATSPAIETETPAPRSTT